MMARMDRESCNNKKDRTATITYEFLFSGALCWNELLQIPCFQLEPGVERRTPLSNANARVYAKEPTVTLFCRRYLTLQSYAANNRKCQGMHHSRLRQQSRTKQNYRAFLVHEALRVSVTETARR